MRHIGDLIYAKRKQLKLTQTQLSNKSQVPRSTISRIEHGELSPSLDALERIVELGFDMEFGEFIVLYKTALKNKTADFEVLSLIIEASEPHTDYTKLDTLGAVLKSLRRQFGYTQDQIAAALGITKAGYSRYECDLSSPTKDNLVALSEYFNVPLKYLMQFAPSNIVDLNGLDKDDIKFVFKLVDTLRISKKQDTTEE